MNAASLQPLLDWIVLHPTWAGIGVFLLSLSESLAIVGLFVPGTLAMFGVGALIATGHLGLWSTMAWAVTGAIAGDGASFWLGHHFREHLRDMWPFSRYPALLERGERFFRSHGGKSIVLGRFVGPVRPIIPVVAGMVGMTSGRFLLYNTLSALAWAPAYMLPGVVFGASLGLASQVASRLAVLLVTLVVLLWLMLWLVRRLAAFLQTRADALVTRLQAWDRRHPWLGEVGASLIDPRHPESRGLLILAAVLLLSAWAFFTLTQGVMGSGAPLSLDSSVFNFLQDLRTPWADRVMVFVTELGDPQVYLPVTLAVLGWLLARRNRSAAAHWIAAVGFGALMTYGLKWLLRVPRPTRIDGVLTYSFPSGHTTMSIVVFGFLAVLVARELPGPRRWLVYVAAGLIVTPIAVSRLYLGAHWLSDVLGGLTLGLAWVALLGIAYRRHPAPAVPVRGLIITALITLTAAGAWHVNQSYDRDLGRYALRHTTRQIAFDAWWQNGWEKLPAYRVDLRGEREQPMSIQWAGDLQRVRTRLEARGWRKPVALTFSNTLLWLSPHPALAELPLLPQVHDGRDQSLLLTYPSKRTPDQQWVLRLWPADVRLSDSGVPVWTGYVARQRLAQPLGLLAFPRTENDFDAPLRKLQGFLGGLSWRVAHRPGPHLANHGRERARWNGDVLLIHGP